MGLGSQPQEDPSLPQLCLRPPNTPTQTESPKTHSRRCLTDLVLPVTRLQKPRLHAPRTRASLANSLQSDLRWMMILVPVLTPEASAISNTPELRHIQKRESQFHTSLLTKPIWQVQSLFLGIFTGRAQQFESPHRKKRQSATFSEPCLAPQPPTLSGTVAVEVWGAGLSHSLRTAPAHQELLLGFMSGWRQTLGGKGQSPGDCPTSYISSVCF